MSNADQDVQTIQAIYAAFGTQDVPGILGRVTADVRFAFQGASPDVPWHGPWTGHAGLGKFFAALGEHVAFEAFEPRTFSAGGGAVAVRLHLKYRVARTGKTVEQDQVHWWTLRDGKVCDLLHFEDTAQVIAACT